MTPMKPFLRAFAFVGLCGGLSVAQAQPTPPPNVIFRPTVLTADVSYYAGMAFRIQQEGSGLQFLVTAHSLFGPSADLDVQLNNEEIQRAVMGLVGVSCTDPRVVVLARRYLPLVGARRSDDAGSEKDIAVFELSPTPSEPALILDRSPALKGDKVWIFVKYAGTNRVGLEPAVIEGVSKNEIHYAIENQEVNLTGTLGAPVLSSDGSLVAMHLGFFPSAAGRKIGFGSPADAIADVFDPNRERPVSVMRPVTATPE